MTARIMGTGSALPETIITNEQIAELVDTSDEWIRERTGIGARHISTGETVASLASQAGRKALENAGKSAQDIDLILVATCSAEMALPCVACQVQDALQAQNAVAFDVNAACAGFLFALHTAYAYLSAGIYRTALVIGAEVLSKILDWKDRSSCILFGDGAGAVVLEQSEEGGILGFVQNVDGSRGKVLSCGSRRLENPYYTQQDFSSFVQMNGREVFAFAVRQVPASIEAVLQKTKLTTEEIDFFLLHQANKRIIEGIAKRLKTDISRFPMNLERVGNMSSASIPVLLDEMNRQGKLKRGGYLVLSGFGAGLTFGATLLQW